MKLLDFITPAIFVQDTDCTDYKPIPEHHRFHVKDTYCTDYKPIPENHRFSLKKKHCIDYEPIPKHHRFSLKTYQEQDRTIILKQRVPLHILSLLRLDKELVLILLIIKPSIPKKHTDANNSKHKKGKIQKKK